VAGPDGVSASQMPMINGVGGRSSAATYHRPVSVTPIRLLGDPVLTTPAAPVVDFDAELHGLVADLTETMFEAGGAGLAAPQLGVGLRVFTWYVDGEVGHLVNPDVAPVGEETEEGPEGCLSIPGFRWDCRRHLHVVATGWNMHGDPVRVEGSELLARAIQHETDHLDGVLFVDRLDPEARVAALAEIAEAEWAGMGAYLPVSAPVVKVSPH
jgi:peptide deformylase